MTDYIKREDALKAVDDIVCDADDAERTCDRIIDLPSADVAPVRHGWWKHERLPSTSGGSYAVVRCSVCEHQYPMTETNYCPSCGAKMDKEIK